MSAEHDEEFVVFVGENSAMLLTAARLEAWFGDVAR